MWLLLLAVVASAHGFSDNPFFYEHWCSPGCQKVFPGNLDRELQCGALTSEAKLPPGYVAEQALANVTVNTTALDFLGAVLEPLNVAVILVRRTPSGMYYRYVSNGKHDVPAETWSASKIFAVATAGDTLRGSCAQPVGLTSTTVGVHGATPLGDLASVVTSYDTTSGYSSNGVAKFFGEVGGVARLNELVQGWLQRGSAESMGGSYGTPPPADLIAAPTFTSWAQPGATCSVAIANASTVDNTLSALTMAEWLRRLVLHRNVSTPLRMPSLQWPDVQQLLYGDATSQLFGPNLTVGGMSVSSDIMVQLGVNITQVDVDSEGQWRIFSKYGAGYSTSRLVGELLVNSYACFPVVRDGVPQVDAGGVEFIVSARVSVPGDSHLAVASKQIVAGVGALTAAVYSGALQ